MFKNCEACGNPYQPGMVTVCLNCGVSITIPKFCDFVGVVDHGRFQQELDQKLQQLVYAMQLHGKKGALDIKFKFTAEGGAQVVVEGIVKVTEPRPTPGRTLLFTTEDAGLSRSNPKQLELLESINPKLPG